MKFCRNIIFLLLVFTGCFFETPEIKKLDTFDHEVIANSHLKN